MGPIDTRIGSHVHEWGEDVETKMVPLQDLYALRRHWCFILFHVFF